MLLPNTIGGWCNHECSGCCHTTKCNPEKEFNKICRNQECKHELIASRKNDTQYFKKCPNPDCFYNVHDQEVDMPRWNSLYYHFKG